MVCNVFNILVCTYVAFPSALYLPGSRRRQAALKPYKLAPEALHLVSPKP